MIIIPWGLRGNPQSRLIFLGELPSLEGMDTPLVFSLSKVAPHISSDTPIVVNLLQTQPPSSNEPPS